MGVHVKVAGAWKQIGLDASGGALVWAKVSGGTVTTYTKADGSVMEVHTFTANGTLTVDQAGYADVLIVGAGSSSTGSDGTGGRVMSGAFQLPADALTVTIGTTVGGLGQPSILGSLASGPAGRGVDSGNNSGAGGTAASPDLPFTSSITGASATYAGSAQSASSTTYGDGTSKAGVVIVAVQQSPATVSGVIASGGTETTFVGDGTNGILGQTYKVHTFTASGTFTVTQGGEVEVLLCSGGGSGDAGWSGVGGGGGGVIQTTLDVSAAAMAVTVGAGGSGGVNGVDGGASRFGPLTAGWGRCVGNNGGGGRSGNGYDGNGGRGGGAGGAATASVPGPGVTSYISGSAVEYGKGGTTGSAAPTLPGQGGTGGNSGAAGRVVIRYKVAA